MSAEELFQYLASHEATSQLAVSLAQAYATRAPLARCGVRSGGGR